MTPSRETESSYDSPYRSMNLDDIKIPKNHSRLVKYLALFFLGFLIGVLVVNTFVKTRVIKAVPSACQDSATHSSSIGKVECNPDQFLTMSNSNPIWWICRCKGNE